MFNYYYNVEEEDDHFMEYRELVPELKNIAIELNNLKVSFRDIRSLMSQTLTIDNQLVHEDKFDGFEKEVDFLIKDLKGKVIPKVSSKTMPKS